MKDFAALCARIDEATDPAVKLAALSAYFRSAPDADKLWALALLSGRRPKRSATAGRLRDWAAAHAGLPLWLFDDSCRVVGDLAETISLIFPAPARSKARPLCDWIAEIQRLGTLDAAVRKAAILAAWDSLPPAQRLVFTKLLTGSFRTGVSRRLMIRALAQATQGDAANLTHRLTRRWTPDTTSWQTLTETPDPSAALSQPYPFHLACGLQNLDELGPASDWNAEWKWDGIRCQLILRGGEHHIWSRGEDLLTDRFPELAVLRDLLPGGTVIDGTLLAFRDGTPLSRSALQPRIGRKTLTKKLLAEVPVILMAHDLLEDAGTDIRDLPFTARRSRLTALCAALPGTAPLRLSPALAFDDWPQLAAVRDTARDHHAGGLMLKRLNSRYLSGRQKGEWWKWNATPLTIDAVLIYAQQGADRPTDYTFAVWSGPDLVPVTKTCIGLTEAETHQITAWVRKNTLQKFGPVRQVPPMQVFEIAFEAIQASPRHKSGVALRLPRMLGWRQDRPVQEANTLQDLEHMLARYG